MDMGRPHGVQAYRRVGSRRRRMGSHGVTWGRMGSHGVTWGRMGSHGVQAYRRVGSRRRPHGRAPRAPRTASPCAGHTWVTRGSHVGHTWDHVAMRDGGDLS
eukprot:3325989-Prymnesium_polylepis.1